MIVSGLFLTDISFSFDFEIYYDDAVFGKDASRNGVPASKLKSW